MAKLQVLIAMTLDGSIPAEDDPLITMDERRQGRILIRARQMYPPALSGLSACGFHVRERHVRPIHPLSSRDT